jgi:hypothetical protein
MEGMEPKAPLPEQANTKEQPDAPIEKNRAKEGEDLFVSQLEALNRYLAQARGTFDGFKRDFRIFTKVDTLTLPELTDNTSFKELEKSLSEASLLLDNEIEVPDLSGTERKQAVRSLTFIDSDLQNVSTTFASLMSALTTTQRLFDSFNGENITQGKKDANISYDIDALASSIVLAKEVAEKAVILDISVRETVRRLQQAA